MARPTSCEIDAPSPEQLVGVEDVRVERLAKLDVEGPRPFARRSLPRSARREPAGLANRGRSGRSRASP